ncbi:MAG: YceI family protein [Bacteriovoracaceae bacterium]|jgi:polyisoprenoid-binding protein YceI|nr:YceI family protein [Bacteriovoracaceae bacterium]
MKSLLIALLTLSFAYGAGVDLKKSSLKWTGTKVTGKHFGKIFFKSADLKMKDGKISKGNFVVDVTSLTVDDISGEWATKLANHLKNDDFFEVNKYPTATLKITSTTDKVLKGTLTIKKISNPIEISYTKKGNTLTGKMEFDRTKFNIKYKSSSFFKSLGDKAIHDKVTVDFNIVTM